MATLLPISDHPKKSKNPWPFRIHWPKALGHFLLHRHSTAIPSAFAFCEKKGFVWRLPVHLAHPPDWPSKRWSFAGLFHPRFVLNFYAKMSALGFCLCWNGRITKHPKINPNRVPLCWYKIARLLVKFLSCPCPWPLHSFPKIVAKSTNQNPSVSAMCTICKFSQFPPFYS